MASPPSLGLHNRLLLLVGDRRWDCRVWLEQSSDLKCVKRSGGQKCGDNSLEMWHLLLPSLAQAHSG